MSLQYIISKNEISKYWGSKEKHPTLSEEARKARLEEVERTSRRLGDLLSSMGFISNKIAGTRGRYDFYQNHDVSLFRYIGFEMTDQKMMQKNVLESIAEFLKGLPEDYWVFISNDFDDSIELFFIVVTKDIVYGQFETEKSARLLGFDPKSGEIGPIQPKK
jgi:hypothetical protein